MDQPLAYHITFGTYGTRLHGDQRGTIHHQLNKPGDPIIGRNEDWHRLNSSQMKFSSVHLSLIQRQFVEKMSPDICGRGGWQHHICACASDHIHVLHVANRVSKVVRRWYKYWLSQKLSDRWPLEQGRR